VSNLDPLLSFYSFSIAVCKAEELISSEELALVSGKNFDKLQTRNNIEC
jgi:hypothetical protein